ncbi:MAG: methyltransferase domain-containing protein [Chloroflexi bacterium]|nr:methyltransferase domain-containing protein [Chloroflexota bacterium]
MSEYAQPIVKLEIGAGEHPCEGGFIHNDLAAYPHIELVGDAAELPLPSDSLHFIRAMHVFEHFSPFNATCTLREWRRLLVPEGVLELALPNGELLVSLWATGQLPYANLIRDLLGLPPPEVLIPPEREARRQFATHGWSTEFRKYIYAQTAFLPCGKIETAQSHRWAYAPREMERLLSEFGFHRIHVKIDGTALHIWASKEAIRPMVGFEQIKSVFRGEAIAPGE